MSKLYDVVAVDLRTNIVRFIAKDKTSRNAEAIEDMAVMRRGCDEEFFATTAKGAYKAGDVWDGIK